MKLSCLAPLLLLAGCSALPRDPDGTLARVERSHRFRVGLIAAPDQPLDQRASAYVARVAQATGARPLVKRGASEPLLLDLEAGGLDLVVGPVAKDSPWRPEVAILLPLAERHGDQALQLTPIARNGENRWIMLLEREARAIARRRSA